MEKPVKCLLLDDELPGLTYLKMLCEQIPELEIVRAFNDPVLFLQESDRIDFDACFLDVEMPGIDGLSVARRLKNRPVIFTTAYKQYAVDAFDVDAVDYLIKPIKKERLQAAVQKLIQRVESKSQSSSLFVRLNTDKGRALLYFDRVLYVGVSAVDSRDKQVLLDDRTTLVLKNISFDRLLSLLPVPDFCQINKQEVIALKTVRFFSHSEISTSIPSAEGFLTLHLNEAYRESFIEKTSR